MLILNYCGFEAKETYDILKAISKKKEEKIEEIKPKFFKDMIENIIRSKLEVMSK